MIKDIFLQKKVSRGIFMMAGLFVFFGVMMSNVLAAGGGTPDLADDYVVASAIQSDGQMIIGGWFENYNEVAAHGIARLNPDGSRDTSFSSGLSAGDRVNDLVIQPDGKIVITGDFNTYDGVTRYGVARLDSDGTLDTSFDLDSGMSGSGDVIELQSDGKILLAGWFNNGTTHKFMRLNANGALDSGFNHVNVGEYDIQSIAVDSVSQKIIIGGYFMGIHGSSMNQLARLNTNGTIDTTFNVGGSGPSNGVTAVTIQSDGKILIGGGFATYNGISRNRIARLDVDGTLDTLFDPGTGVNGGIDAIVVQSNGKILIGGDFSSYNSVARYNIARLDANGSLDLSFDSGSNNDVETISVQSGGDILIGGRFTQYDGMWRHYIISAFASDGSLNTAFGEPSLQDIIIPNPTPTQIQTRINDGYMSVTEGTLNAATSTETNVNVTYRTESADAVFPTGTSTTKQGGGTVDFANFTINNITETIKGNHPDSRLAFRLGIPGENLSFSQDITVVTTIGNPYNGQELDILYQNEGSTEWNPHSTPTCTVENGTCTFTTNHATIYTVNGEHSVTGQAPMDINVEVQDTLSLDCYETGNSSGDHTVTLSDSVTGTGYVVAGIPSVGQSTCNVTTNDDQGYFLTINRSTEDVLDWNDAGGIGDGQHATATSVMIHEDPNNDGTWYEIEDQENDLAYYTGTNSAVWTEGTTKGLGFSVITFPDTTTGNNTLDDDWALGGTPCLDGSNTGTDTAKYAAVPTNAQAIAAVTQYESGPTTTNICYKVDVLASQESGQYAGQVTYTATSDASGYYTN